MSSPHTAVSASTVQDVGTRRARSRRGRRPRPRPTVLSVMGELLITVGVFLLLFVAWELWWTDVTAGREQDTVRQEVVQQWQPDADYDGEGADPAVVDGSGAWGFLYVPRLGAEWSVPVADGVGSEVIDRGLMGRYSTASLPGEEGNLSLAGHRQTHGSILWDLDQVVPGDLMYVQTANGWWVYRTVQNHIVAPTQTEVLDPNPLDPGGPAAGRWLTLTTCHPLFSTRERMITHAEYVSFVPSSQGPPAEIADAVAKNGTPELEPQAAEGN
ncbi:MAG: class E sortase [Micrococcaceae bacterium]